MQSKMWTNYKSLEVLLWLTEDWTDLFTYCFKLLMDQLTKLGQWFDRVTIYKISNSYCFVYKNSTFLRCYVVLNGQ
jgi:hypothetical protein